DRKKTRLVLWVVLDTRGDEGQVPCQGGSFARDCGNTWIHAGDTSRLGVAGSRIPYQARTVLSQPGLALSQRLGMSHDTGHPVERAMLAHQRMMYFYRALAQDLE